MNYLTNIWNWLNGKKRVLGILVVFVAGGLNALELLDAETFKWLVGVGGTLSAVGVGHAIIKAR